MNKHILEAINEVLDVNVYESEILSKNNINNVVDKNAAKTDTNKLPVPTDKIEFETSIQDLVDSHPNTDFRDIYQRIKQEFEDGDSTMSNKIHEASELFKTVTNIKKLALQSGTSIETILDMVQSHPDIDVRELGKVLMTKKGTMKKTVESIIRESVNKILNEVLPQNQRMKPGDYRNAKPPTPEELEDLRKMLARIKTDDDDDENVGYQPRRTLGKGDEQSGQILQTLRDTFGIDMSNAQFPNFDKGTKMRWFATAVLSNKDPRFLERTVTSYVSDLEDAAKDSGVLDKELEEELLELEDLLLADPTASQAFSEYLQQEVQDWVESLNDAQWKDLVDRANDFFKDIPAGIMKYNKEGIPDYDFLRTMMRRRQSSKDFSGGGSIATGGGSSLDRFKAGVEHSSVPAEE